MSSASTKPSQTLGGSPPRNASKRLEPAQCLAVDTSFSRHRGTSPKLLEGALSAEDSLQGVQSGNVPSAGDHKVVKGLPSGLPSRPDAYRQRGPHNVAPVSDRSLNPHPLNKRVHGLRPSPLKLNDVSPSDRIVPIGIDISKAPIQHRTYEPVTPTILITPAREDFAQCNTTTQAALLGLQRPASSVYSGMPCTADFEKTPPVPPLPLFAMQGRMKPILERTQTVTESIGAVVKEDNADARSHKATLSVCTVFEEDDAASKTPMLPAKHPQRGRSRRFTSRSQLPTPRRSHGWWNFVTSPFSAGTNGHFWQSPALHEEERTPILRNAFRMSDEEVAGRMSSDSNNTDFEESRSAGVDDQDQQLMRTLPTRASTAPANIGSCTPEVDIYRIPSQGEAAAYYDASRHFPSLILDHAVSSPLSALTDVCACERHNHGAPRSFASGNSSPATTAHDTAQCATVDMNAQTRGEAGGPASLAPGLSMFASPTTDELVASDGAPPTTTRDMSQHGTISQASPLSATPVIQHAHLAAIVGPQSTRGEPRAITVVSSRPPSPPAAPEVVDDASYTQTLVHPALKKSQPIVRERPILHSRNDSFGLGITSEEKEIFYVPKPLSEKPRLGTDRFGQLKIMTAEDDAPREPFHRRFFWLLTGIASLLLLLLIVLLVVLIPQKHRDTAVQAQWLNLTAFPPLPTGVTTVVQPATSQQESGCVAQRELWTCEAFRDSATPTQPDFRFGIRFRNHTSNQLNSTELSPDLSKRGGNLRARTTLQVRDAWASSLWASSPALPSEDGQIFLGNTTDNITAPFDGEETPFYLSLLDPVALGSLTKRQSDSNPYPYPTTGALSNSSISTNTSTTAAQSIPKPVKLADNRPLPDVLYPYAKSQPLRLYNRGAPDEHYGFYTYFDRSLVVSNVSNPKSDTTAPDNSSSAVCTWSQTRLHVQFWTRRDASLLSGDSGSSTSNTTDILPMSNGTSSSSPDISAMNSTANDLSHPGSFPYQTTISLDRHGGDAGKKGVYCYSLDEEGKAGNEGWWVDENRAFGGQLVNAAGMPGTGVLNRDAAVTGKGIDGGSGGCGCEWQNWK